VGRGASYPGPHDVSVALLSLKNIKFTRMHYIEKKNSKYFSLEGPQENVSLGPAVALDGL